MGLVAIGALVRDSCRRATEQARLVRLHPGPLDALAEQLREDLEPFLDPLPSAGHGPAATEREVGLVLMLDAINFGSGYHDTVTKLPGLSGAKTMAAHLRRWASEGEAPTPDQLVGLTAADCTRIFAQNIGHPDQQELMALFATALADLGQFVLDKHGGSYVGLVAQAEGSAQVLAESLLAMTFYQDRRPLNGEDVHFYKRAQITAADLARELGRRHPADFNDLHELTAFADNLVPHVLRVDGVLSYDPAVVAAIDSGRLLQPGSRAEIEIRAFGVEAVELLTRRLRPSVPSIRAMDVDLALWTRGGAPAYKAVPRHRTRCVHY